MTAVTLIVVISYLIGIGVTIEIIDSMGEIDKKWYKRISWYTICVFILAFSPVVAFVKLGGNIWNQD